MRVVEKCVRVGPHQGDQSRHKEGSGGPGGGRETLAALCLRMGSTARSLLRWGRGTKRMGAGTGGFRGQWRAPNFNISLFP